MKDTLVRQRHVAERRLVRHLFRSSCRGLGKGGLHVAHIHIPKGRIYVTRVVDESSRIVCRGLKLRVKARRNRGRAKRSVKLLHFAP